MWVPQESSPTCCVILLACFMVLRYRRSAGMSLFRLKSTFCKLSFEFWLLVNTAMLLVNERLGCSQLFIRMWSFS